MNKAVANLRNWKSGNTEVVSYDEKDVTEVYLHNNLIAVLGDNFIQLFDGNFKSSTTKSRLNALLSENSVGEFVFQKKGEWFLNDNGNVIPFVSGMILQ